MNDTQQEFEKVVSDAGWASNYQGDGQYAGVTIPFAWKMWQACQRLNDARINTVNDAITEGKIVQDRITSLESQLASALAANQVMREALTKIASLSQDTDLLWWQNDARAALAIKPGDVTLVEYAEMYNFGDGNAGINYKNDLRKGDIVDGTKLYAIQTKE